MDKIHVYPTTLTGLAVTVWFISGNYYLGWFQYLRPYTTGLVLATVLCHSETLLARTLSSQIMRYIAAVSYALYVVHPLTIYGWFNQGSRVERYLFKRPISFMMMIGAAHISTFYWEKFWIQTGRKWIEARRMRLAKSAVKAGPIQM